MVIIFLDIYKFLIKFLLLELLLLLTLMCMMPVLVELNTIFLASGFTQKYQKAQILCIPLKICNIWYNFAWSGSNSHEIATKLTISGEFGLLKVKVQYHMFSGIKIEEYMESEISGIFW